MAMTIEDLLDKAYEAYNDGRRGHYEICLGTASKLVSLRVEDQTERVFLVTEIIPELDRTSDGS